jgi:hypothetical protein
MRTLLLILLIALLPLSSWAGGAMAIHTSAQGVAQGAVHSGVHSAASDRQALEPAAPQAGHGAHAGHHGSASASEPAQHSGAGQMGQHAQAQAPDCATHDAGSDPCKNCQSCQICHSVALSLDSIGLGAQPIHAMPRPAAAHDFASADMAPGQKPPIS